MNFVKRIYRNLFHRKPYNLKEISKVCNYPKNCFLLIEETKKNTSYLAMFLGVPYLIQDDAVNNQISKTNLGKVEHVTILDDYLSDVNFMFLRGATKEIHIFQPVLLGSGKEAEKKVSQFFNIHD